MPLAQGNNTPTRPRIEPGSPDPESDALTIRPVRSHTNSLCNVPICNFSCFDDMILVLVVSVPGSHWLRFLHFNTAKDQK